MGILALADKQRFGYYFRMISYILLIFIIALVALSTVRALGKERSKSRSSREPYFDPHQSAPSSGQVLEEEDGLAGLYQTGAEEWVSAPRDRKTVEVETLLIEENVELEDADSFNEGPGEAVDVIVINLFADEARLYRGYELLQSILSTGLRYGKQGIFHRYEEISDRGKILFNLASAIEPGVFNLANMGNFHTPGLTLFMQASAVTDPFSVFELMLSTANKLVKDLGGQLLDEQRSPLLSQKITQWRKSLSLVAQEI